MLNGNRTADPFETWHKNRSALKVVLFVFKIFKMATNIKIKKNKNKLLRIQKWKDFNGNGYLQVVRHAAPYDDHFGLLLFESHVMILQIISYLVPTLIPIVSI
jgi:hypothetical protein